MAILAPQAAKAPAGTVITYADASAGGDRVAPGSNILLLVKNGSGASVTVTLDATGTAFNGAAIPDTAVVVAAGADAIVPVLPNYRSDSDGLAGVSYSAAASVKVAVLKA